MVNLSAGMLDSQHSTVAFSNWVELLTKKPVVRIWQCLPIIRYTGYVVKLIGGADRDRTDDLLNAIQALSQTELQPHLG